MAFETLGPLENFIERFHCSCFHDGQGRDGGEGGALRASLLKTGSFLGEGVTLSPRGG